MKRLTEYEETVVRNLFNRILLDKDEGRRLGRFFTAERGKEDGDYVQVKKEILDIFSDVINDLYTSPSPVMS